MTKEILKKILNIDTFNNIKAMIKSSNEEDFFIGVHAWINLNPPDMLTAILKKHAWKGRGHLFDEQLKEAHKWPLIHSFHRLSWVAILHRTVEDKQYKQYRDIISQEFNAYMNQKLLNEGIGKNIKPIKTEIKWQN